VTLSGVVCSRAVQVMSAECKSQKEGVKELELHYQNEIGLLRNGLLGFFGDLVNSVAGADLAFLYKRLD
jgi:hypothetical protein